MHVELLLEEPSAKEVVQVLAPKILGASVTFSCREFQGKVDPRRGRFPVVNRIAVEELEAWFFGDVEAMRRVCPKIPRTLADRQGYRDPDAIQGGSWEALERVLKSAGHLRGSLPKISVARNIAPHGPGARRMEEERVLGIKAQCHKAGVPFFFKQWGGFNKKKAGRLLQGRTWDELPKLAVPALAR